MFHRHILFLIGTRQGVENEVLHPATLTDRLTPTGNNIIICIVNFNLTVVISTFWIHLPQRWPIARVGIHCRPSCDSLKNCKFHDAPSPHPLPKGDDFGTSVELMFFSTKYFFPLLAIDQMIWVCWPNVKKLQILTYAQLSWLLSSEDSLLCHTYCDTRHLFIMVIYEVPWHSHLLPRV